MQFVCLLKLLLQLFIILQISIEKKSYKVNFNVCADQWLPVLQAAQYFLPMHACDQTIRKSENRERKKRFAYVLRGFFLSTLFYCKLNSEQ